MVSMCYLRAIYVLSMCYLVLSVNYLKSTYQVATLYRENIEREFLKIRVEPIKEYIEADTPPQSQKVSGQTAATETEQLQIYMFAC